VCCLRLYLALWPAVALMTHLKAHKVGVRLKDIRFKASGAPRMLASMACQPDTIDFRFWYSAESPILVSVTHTVSAKSVTSLSVSAEK